jgi:hypothetical protein
MGTDYCRGVQACAEEHEKDDFHTRLHNPGTTRPTMQTTLRNDMTCLASLVSVTSVPLRHWLTCTFIYITAGIARCRKRDIPGPPIRSSGYELSSRGRPCRKKLQQLTRVWPLPP